MVLELLTSFFIYILMFVQTLDKEGSLNVRIFLDGKKLCK